MDEGYFISLTDDEGQNYKLEVLGEVEFGSDVYGVFLPADMDEEDPDYGEIICRCQHITKKEICQAIENPLGVKTISAIKYRAWPTTGRCQGGYCLNRIVEILEKEYGIAPEHITQRGDGSELFSGRVKE